MSAPIDLDELEQDAIAAGDYIAEFTGALVVELIHRLRAAEDAARFFYAKLLNEGAVLDDETCGEKERHEAAIPNLEARVVPVDDPEMLPTSVRCDKTIDMLAESASDNPVLCQHCDNTICHGTGIYEGRKCDGIPF